MRYSGIHPKAREELLSEIGVGSIDDLFSSVPTDVRMREELPVEGPIPEVELLGKLEALKPDPPRVSLAGGGLYHHFIPSTARSLMQRSEWITSYTPYQAESAQGTLVMYYEFQTYIAMLTGQEVANGGMYDGSTALAEAILMARRLRPKARIVHLSEGVHPEYREVVASYLRYQDVEIRTLPLDPESGRTSIDIPREEQRDALAIVVQSPNFFGIVEEASNLDPEAFTIAVCAEAQSLALLPPFPAHVSVGEAQSLGVPIQLGGPTAGFFATSKQHVRQLPGRLVGRTVDREGREAYCITLATREQFIRRGKATSNICTASGLMCLRVVLYLSLMGREGLQEVARMSARSARAVARELEGMGLRRPFSGTIFNEFVVDASSRPDLYAKLLERGFVMGLPLGRWYPEMKDHYLVALSELHYPRLGALIEEVKDVAQHS